MKKYNKEEFLQALASPHLREIVGMVDKNNGKWSIADLVAGAISYRKNLYQEKPSRSKYASLRHITYLIKIGYFSINEDSLILLNEDFIPTSQVNNEE